MQFKLRNYYYLLHSNVVRIHQMIYHTLVHHMKTVDMNTPHDLQRTRFNTCKNSSAKAKSSDRRKRSYFLHVAAETFIINVHQQIYTRTPFCQPFHFNVSHKAFF